jgi:hypothetical protein
MSFKFDSYVDEPYGDTKQQNLVKIAILNKSQQLENKSFALKPADFTPEDMKHIEIIKTIYQLERASLVELHKVDFSFTNDGDVDFNIKLTLLSKLIGGTKQKPKDFYLDGFILKHGNLSGEINLKGEKNLEYRTMKAILKFKPGKKIDALDADIDGFDPMAFAADRLNKKILDIFKIDKYIKVEWSSKMIFR